MSSSMFEYLVTESGSSPFTDNSSNSSDPGGEGGGRPLRWGMLSLSILIVATASGNILVCLAVSWERRLQNMTNYFLMSLAIADLLVSLLVMPLAMIVELFGFFPLGQSLCVIWATMDVLLCTASIWHMCTMSMDRYFTIRYPIRYGRNRTKKMMTLKITFVWIISFAVSVPLAIAGFVDYSNVYAKGKCLPSIKNFVLYGSIFAFYVPLIIMVTTYTLTIRILRQNRFLMSGLDGNSHAQVPDAGDGSQRGSHRLSGPLRIGETTRMSCPSLSPPHSGLTITSVGMTSAKNSSAESAMSPEREPRWFNTRGSQQPKSKVLKVNLADEANYVNCNFDQLLLKNTETRNAIGRHQTPSRSTGPQTILPKHSNSRIIRRSSHPIIFRSRNDAGDPWCPSLLFLRISRRYSDTNIASLQSGYSYSVLDTSCSISDDQKPNGSTRSFGQDQIKAENGALLSYANGYLALKDHHQPISFRLTSSSSVENVVDERYADFKSSFRRIDEGELPKRNSPLCLQTTQTTTDINRDPSPFPVDGVGTVSFGGSYLDSFQLERAWTLSGDGSRRFEEKQKNGRGLPMTDVNCCEEPTSGSLTTRHPNGSAKDDRTVDPILKEDDGEEPEDVRSLLVAPSRRKCPPPPPLMMAESWKRYSPPVDTSPSRSGNRAFSRAHVDRRRMPRKLPSACARKISSLSKSRNANERKASKVLGIIFAVFVLSWTPFFTMNIISVVCVRCMESVTDSMMASIVWLGYLSSLANPIIYTMFSTSFRTVFYRILTCQYKQAAGCGRVRRQSSEESYLCWSKNRRTNSLKEFGCESKICGV